MILWACPDPDPPCRERSVEALLVRIGATLARNIGKGKSLARGQRLNNQEASGSAIGRPQPRKRRWRYGVGVGLSAIALALGLGAWKLRPFLQLFTEEISVTTLARFANGGALTNELAAYNAVPNIEQLRPFLTAPLYYGPPETIPSLVTSPEGEVLLERLGELLLTRDRQNSGPVLRQALIQAAADENLSLLHVLRQFPEAKLRINGTELWRTGLGVAQTWQRQRGAIARLERQSDQERSGPKPQLLGVPELVQRGEQITRMSWLLEDVERERAIWLDLHLPNVPPETVSPTVVISHGLTANRRTFAYLARHLASHGFLVVAVEHPDSNGEAHRRFLAGQTETLLPPNTLMERPRDISFVLDSLENAGLEQWFDLKNVGIMGHSLGGNTALAIAGAKLDRAQLEQSCAESSQSFNLSLIFAQCPLLTLPEVQTQQNLRDERITSVVAISPVASQVFSHESLQQLSVPLLMVASEQDWITPALEEQIVPFEQVRSTAPVNTPTQPGSLRSRMSSEMDVVLASARALWRSPQLPEAKRPESRGSSLQASQPESAPPQSATAPPTYLALLRGGAHWTTMGGYACLLPGPRQELGASLSKEESFSGGNRGDLSRKARLSQKVLGKAIARDYLCSLSTAFFKTTLEDAPLQPYLSADYAAMLSHPQLPLLFVESLSANVSAVQGSTNISDPASSMGHLAPLPSPNSPGVNDKR